ncbi:MAG TPA: transcriptional regulator [Stellaceae bacterium]|nr:transcriptional regulator [Stellaceae bacterium]
MAISPPQCRSARTLLSWSVSKLAAAAGVADSAIDDFELERRPLDGPVASAVRRAFEEVGIVFLPQDDVRLDSEVA